MHLTCQGLSNFMKDLAGTEWMEGLWRSPHVLHMMFSVALMFPYLCFAASR